MNIYDVREIEEEVEQIAKENEGEIPPEKMEALVKARMGTLEQIEKLVKYIKFCEYMADNADAEVERIKEMKRIVQNRAKSIAQYLTPYVREKKKITVGTFALSIRKSDAVILADDFNNKDYMTEKITYTADKGKIKEALKSGQSVSGAILEIRDNLQIK
jgi:hypothetical protein